MSCRLDIINNACNAHNKEEKHRKSTTTMLVQAHSLSTPLIFLPHHQRRFPLLSCFDSLSNGFRNKHLHSRQLQIISASGGQSWSVVAANKRKVVEHICLLKAKEGLSDEKEECMLDFLYTSQYQMRGIIAISLGRISDQNIENYTHAIFMRFQRKEDLAKFYENPFYVGVLENHVMPHCHGSINVDYESEVEDDILPIFRKGEEFNCGVEFMLLIAFNGDAFGGPAEDALSALEKLTIDFPSLIVQSTKGSNFNLSSKEYTHGVVIRFRSLEALQLFMGSSEYKDMWRSKFQPFTQRTLAVYFSVDPVGTEIM